MRNQTKADRIDAALTAHYRGEIARFQLKPWDVAPVFLSTYETPAATDTSPAAESWRRAKAWRDEMLAADSGHYKDIGG